MAAKRHPSTIFRIYGVNKRHKNIGEIVKIQTILRFLLAQLNRHFIYLTGATFCGQIKKKCKLLCLEIKGAKFELLN